MNEEQKAKELIEKMYAGMKWFSKGRAKECAIIAVDEIMKLSALDCDRYEEYYSKLQNWQTETFWQKVKEIINN